MVGGVSTVEIGASAGQSVGLSPIKDVAGLENRVRQRQAEVAKVDSTAQARREVQSLEGTPAEGMDLDPRYKTIEGELERAWLETHPGKDWFSGEAQDYRFGTGAENAKFISDAEKLFRQRYPEDAAGYDAKEQTRIYEQTGTDPAIRKIEQDIRTAVFNDSEVRQAREGKDPNKYRETHFAVEAREARSAWDEFIRRYPEKAKAYGEKGYTDILRALERQELKKQEQERQAEILAKSKAEDVSSEPPEAQDGNTGQTQSGTNEGEASESAQTGNEQVTQKKGEEAIDLRDPNSLIKLKTGIDALPISDQKKAEAMRAILEHERKQKTVTPIELVLLILSAVIQEAVGMVIPRGR